MTDLEAIDNLEFVGEHTEKPEDEEEEEENEPTLEDLREVSNHRRREEEEWRKTQRDQLIKNIPELPE